MVSIPQAVGTIAISPSSSVSPVAGLVSIPQAVGTIAIVEFSRIDAETREVFQYRKR